MHADPALVNAMVLLMLAYFIIRLFLPRALTRVLHRLIFGLLKGFLFLPYEVILLVVQCACHLIAERRLAVLATDVGHFVERVCDNFLSGFKP